VRSIDRAQIVEAALDLLDAEGLSGVTTRRVATQLGIKSASLYWHIRDREELLDLLSDRIVADARWPDSSTEWREQVERLMHEYLRCLLDHRDAARVVAGRPPRGPNRLRGAEMLLRTLVRTGLSGQESIDAGLVLTTYVVGFALEEQASARPLPATLDEDFIHRYPTLSGLADLALNEAGSSRFGYGLALVLDGISARIAAAAGPKRRRH
jgi:TetR/AcrR family transcriptional regulator, tetracycline repressor protein